MHAVANTFFVCFVFAPTPPAAHTKVLINFSIFCSFNGNDLLTTFTDDKDGDSSVLDFTVHCLRYDDTVHKEDSVGYRVFLTTSFFVSVLPTPLPPIYSLHLLFLISIFFYLTVQCNSNYIS